MSFSIHQFLIGIFAACLCVRAFRHAKWKTLLICDGERGRWRLSQAHVYASAVERFTQVLGILQK
jgi:hypothetical protein